MLKNVKTCSVFPKKQRVSGSVAANTLTAFCAGDPDSCPWDFWVDMATPGKDGTDLTCRFLYVANPQELVPPSFIRWLPRTKQSSAKNQVPNLVFCKLTWRKSSSCSACLCPDSSSCCGSASSSSLSMGSCFTCTMLASPGASFWLVTLSLYGSSKRAWCSRNSSSVSSGWLSCWRAGSLGFDIIWKQPRG